MSRLEELINELCPDGVEYKTINELFDEKSINCITPSFKIKRNDYKTNGLIPIVSQEAEYISGYCDLEDKRIENSEYVCFGDHSENIKYIDFQFVQGADGLKIIKSKKVNTKYLYYSLSSFYIKMNNYERHFKYLLKTKIPVPPLEVQSEIVHILDSFTLLTAELTAELTARQKQYAFYRDYLLDFNNEDVTKKIPDIDCTNIKYLPLEEVIISLNTGLNPRKFFRLNTDDAKNYYVTIREIKNNKIVFNDKTDRINDEALRLCNNRSNLDVNDILFSGTGTIGETALIESKPNNWNIKEGVYSIKPNSQFIISKYLMYLLQSSKVRSEYLRKAEGGTVKSIQMKKLKEIVIPVPPLSVQENIVKILDRFDKLNNDMSDGLPAEIEARKKQYEYYRDTLLSFDDKACSQIVKVEREREN